MGSNTLSKYMGYWIMAARPKIGFREKTGMISETHAKPGSTRI